MYMGTKGTRLMQEFLPHTFPNGALNPCPACPTGYLYLSSNGNSNRHSGQIQLRRRLRSGLTASVQYTFSKAIDNAPLMAGTRILAVGQGGPAVAQKLLDLKGGRGLSKFY